jgi:hypothetical protein
MGVRKYERYISKKTHHLREDIDVGLKRSNV